MIIYSDEDAVSVKERLQNRAQIFAAIEHLLYQKIGSWASNDTD